jgi:hypothetical protein
MRYTLYVLGTLLLLMNACTARDSEPRSGNRSLITQQEIESVTARSAWEVVQMLRPEFLHLRTVTAMQTTRQDDRIVFLDGRRLGNVDELKTIPTTITITSIRLLSAAEATQRWGQGYRAGAIEVLTRR